MFPIGITRALADALTKYHVVDYEPTGSRVIYPQGATDGTDYDVLCLVPHMPDIAYDGTVNGLGVKKIATSEGVLDLMLTESQDEFDKLVDATNFAKRLAIRDRSDRVILFHLFLYGHVPELEATSIR